MITRRDAEVQAEQCLMYHAGLYALGIAGLSLIGSRWTSLIAAGWGVGLAAHAGLLHANNETRELIVRKTAAGMEDRQRLQQRAVEKVRELVGT